jgi:Mn2+/Fe2+ NRAMP family transporter
VPSIQGGVTSNAVLLIIAIVGTTVAPWQLFFQQSNVIDKRITPRWMGYERADTVIGAFVVVIGAAILMIVTAHAFAGTSEAGNFTDAGGVAAGLAHYVSRGAGALYALVLLDASIVGASAVTLATSYAFGDIFGLRHSLHRGWREAKAFYGSYAALVAVAAVIVIIPNAPLGVMTTAVQALAGILLPSATVFLLLLCNDRAVLGPWLNKPWLNALATVIVGVLLELSAILVITTVFPRLDVGTLLVVLSVVLVLALAVGGLAYLVARRGRAAPAPEEFETPKIEWRMPPLAMLDRPQWSRTRTFAMYTMVGYLVVAVLLLLVKAVELATGH